MTGWARERREHIRDSYKRGARQYDKLLSAESWWAKLACMVVWGFPDTAYTKGLLQRIPDGFTGHLLDIPVGTGLFTAEKYSRMKRASITCVDYSPEMLEQAGRRFAGSGLQNVSLRQGDVGALLFGDGAFDAVLSMNGFHFMHTDIKALLKNRPSAAAPWQSEIDFADMMAGMRKAQQGFRQMEMVSIITALPEYRSARKLLDLGGATGIYGLSAVKLSPDMYCVVYDAPPMERAICESIEELGLSGRAEAMTGDFTKDEIGGGYDIILASASMNFAKPCMDAMLKKIFHALGDNGVFVCVSDGVSQDGTCPPEVVIGWLPYTLAGMDMALPKGFVSDAALRNGFRSVSKETRLMAPGNMDIDIIRK